MAMSVQTNSQALNAYRNLSIVDTKVSKASEKLSSGYRINRAADDAAGLAISEKMRSQIRGLNQASTNSQDGISMIQTAEGALQESQNILQRMRELTVQASNETLTSDDRSEVALELNQLSDELDSIASKTEFNTKKLIDGSWKEQAVYLQTGANSKQGMSFNIGKMDATALGVTKAQIGNIVDIATDATGKVKTAVVTLTVNGVADEDDEFAEDAGIYKVSDDLSITVGQELRKTANGATSATNTVTFSQDVTFVDAAQSAGVTLKAGTYTESQLKASLSQLYKSTDTAGVYDGSATGTVTTLQMLNGSGTSVTWDATTAGAETLKIGDTYSNSATSFVQTTSGTEVTSSSTTLNFTTGTATDKVVGTQLGVDANVTDGKMTVSFSSGFGDVVDSVELASKGTDDNAGNSNLLSLIKNGEDIDISLLNGVDVILKDGTKLTFSATTTAGSLKLNVTQSTVDTKSYTKVTTDSGKSSTVGENISTLLNNIDSALKNVSDQRAKLGAYQNRLEHTISNLEVSAENLTTAESRIRDTDMASQMMEFTSAQVLQQAGTSMLAQANSSTQNVLSLLG